MKSLIMLTLLATSFSFAETTTVHVNGMTCGACVKSITKAVCEDLKYSKENCTVKMGEVTVTADKVDLAAITSAVQKAGYEVASTTPAATSTITTTTTTKTETKAAVPAKKK